MRNLSGSSVNPAEAAAIAVSPNWDATIWFNGPATISEINAPKTKVIIIVIVGSGNLSDLTTNSKINIGGKTVRSNKISSLDIINY